MAPWFRPLPDSPPPESSNVQQRGQGSRSPAFSPTEFAALYARQQACTSRIGRAPRQSQTPTPVRQQTPQPSVVEVPQVEEVQVPQVEEEQTPQESPQEQEAQESPQEDEAQEGPQEHEASEEETNESNDTEYNTEESTSEETGTNQEQDDSPIQEEGSPIDVEPVNEGTPEDQPPEEPEPEPVYEMAAVAAPTPKELSINKPNPFNGDPAKLESFIMDCDLYLSVNRAVYDNDAKKISFILALLTEGNAATWKMQYYKTNQTANGGIFTPPALAQFIRDLRDSFKEVDEEGSLMIGLERLRQGNKTVEQHNTDFKLLAARANLTDDRQLINLY